MRYFYSGSLFCFERSVAALHSRASVQTMICIDPRFASLTLLISYTSKCKSEHAHNFQVISFLNCREIQCLLDSSGLCCYTELNNFDVPKHEILRQIVKLPIKYKQTRLNWCTPLAKNMALSRFALAVSELAFAVSDLLLSPANLFLLCRRFTFAVSYLLLYQCESL